MASNTINVENYGQLLAKVNDLDLISYEEFGNYQGKYIVVLSDDDRIYIYSNSFGSCSGCDWMEDNKDCETGEILYKDALNYCGDIKPRYILPKEVSKDYILKVIFKLIRSIS